MAPRVCLWSGLPSTGLSFSSHLRESGFNFVAKMAIYAHFLSSVLSLLVE